MSEHTYKSTLSWTGNRGTGTASYKSYDRSYSIDFPGKPTLAGSSDPLFLGDPALYNPEDLLLAAVSACHMLWYLHLCSANAITVASYTDDAAAQMRLNKDGSGEFVSVTLRPHVLIGAGEDTAKAAALHANANKMCFVARSLNCPVHHHPDIQQT